MLGKIAVSAPREQANTVSKTDARTAEPTADSKRSLSNDRLESSTRHQNEPAYPTAAHKTPSRRRVRFAEHSELRHMPQNGGPAGPPEAVSTQTKSVEELPEKLGLYAPLPKRDRRPKIIPGEDPSITNEKQLRYVIKRAQRRKQVEDANDLSKHPNTKVQLPAYKYMYHNDAKALGYIS